MLRLEWQKCQKDVWCPLETVDLDHAAFAVTGVFVVWHEGTAARTVRVGHGPIRTCMQALRKDRDVQAYARFKLFFTWAKVAPTQTAGVVAYLADMLKPLVKVPVSQAHPIPVNFPR